MFTFIKRLFGIDTHPETQSSTGGNGATVRQMDFLRQLGSDGENLSRFEASHLIARTLRPVSYAISHTFKKSSELPKEHLRILQIAIAHSDYITSFPRYGPYLDWVKMASRGDPDAPLTKEQRIAVTDTAFRVLPPDIFLSLPSNGVKKYKDILDARLTPRA